MPFNLLLDPFFPVLTRKGNRSWVAFPDLFSRSDEPVEIDWPRADFNAAALELAIGAFILAFQPEKPSDWLKLWAHPPGPEEVAEAIEPFTSAFDLDGDGPRFMQEFGGLEGETTPIEALLIDTPGANGQKKNADVLTHRDRYAELGLPAAAMALYALQQFAPSGGAGNRTSMRGGGPMSTFVLPGGVGGERPSLRQIIIANLPAPGRHLFEIDELPKILPWLAPTLVSDKAHGERLVSEGDPAAHPLQAFFGMPRRIALRFSEAGRCPMTGENGRLVDGFVQKPWGVNYGVWEHPLTPYRRQKEGAEPYSAKPKSARFGYRDWTPIVAGATQGTLATPAQNVGLARNDRIERLCGESNAALRVVGWAMNNMEAIAYLHSEQPLHLAPDTETQRALDSDARRFTEAAETVASLLTQALRTALFSEGAKPGTDKTLFEQARAGFYEATETAFHDALDKRLNDPLSMDDAFPRTWLAHMRRAAFSVFERAAPIPLDAPERARPIADALRELGFALAGFGKAGKSLFETLNLPLPDSGGAKKGKRHGG